MFLGLSDPNRKIRSLCVRRFARSSPNLPMTALSQAHTLSSIANCDWPDEYPELLSSLITLLSSNSLDSVHGAIQVLTEFIKADLTEDQLLPVLRELLPVLLSILGSPEVFPVIKLPCFLLIIRSTHLLLGQELSRFSSNV